MIIIGIILHWLVLSLLVAIVIAFLHDVYVYYINK